MAAPQAAVSFDEIIQADRKRRQNEALAQEIFGKARKTGPIPSRPAAKGRGSGPPSLASRVGVLKASAFNASRKPSNPFQQANNHSFSQNNQQFGRDRPSFNNRSVSASRLERLTSSLQASNGHDVNFRKSANTTLNNGLSIRGTAGPFLVVARNFAPGTTVADIENTLEPVGGEITSCKLTREVPSVVAEITFAEKSGADAVIASFDKQRADGRILDVFHGPSKSRTPRSLPRDDPIIINDSTSSQDRSSVISPPPPLQFNSAREAADLSRRQVTRRADPEIQDGSYGFMEVDAPVSPKVPSISTHRQTRDPQPPPARDTDREEPDNEPRELFTVDPTPTTTPTPTPTGPQSDRSAYPRNSNSNYDRESTANSHRRQDNSSSYPRYSNNSSRNGPNNNGYYRRGGDDRNYHRGGGGGGRDRRFNDYGNRRNDESRNGNGNGGDMDVDVDTRREERSRDTRGRLYSDEIVRGDRGRGGGWGRGREYGR